MKREVKERTPEEIDALTENSRRQYTIVAAIAAMLNFRRWRKMTAAPAAPADDTLDSDNK